MSDGINPNLTLERARERRLGAMTTGRLSQRLQRLERADLTNVSGLVEGVTGLTEPQYIKMDLLPGVPSAGWVEGHLYWDVDWDTLNLQLNDGVAHHIGMELYMPPTVNNSGVTISRGQIVMATGVQGDRITIARAVTNGTVLPDYVIGVAAHDIANGDTDGKIVTQGEVWQINTSAYAIGTILYPDPATAGGWTSTKPAAPNIRTAYAFVLRQHINTGRIMVRMAPSSTLGGTDTNVKFGTLADGDAVTWDSVQNLWINEPVSANALPGISGTGIVARTATTPTYAVRTITGTTNEITVTNGNGVSGNPTISLPSSVTIDNLTVGTSFNGVGDFAVMEDGQTSSITASTASTTVYSDAETDTLTVPSAGTYTVYVMGSAMLAHSAGGTSNLRVELGASLGTAVAPEIATYSTTAAWDRVSCSHTFTGVSITSTETIKLTFKSSAAGTTYARNPQLFAIAIRTA